MKKSGFISAVIYVHNSEIYLKDFLAMLIQTFNDNFKNYEIICVDDFSKDQSVKIIKDTVDSFANHGNLITLVRTSSYQGLETAMNSGLELAVGDFIYEFDSTLIDYNPQILVESYDKIHTGYDIVVVGPTGKGALNSRLFYKIYNWAKKDNKEYRLGTERFRIVSRRAINRVQELTEYIPYRKVAYLNCGLPFATLSFQSVNRIKNYNFQETNYRLELAINILILFTNLVNKVALFLSILFLILTLIVGFYTIIIYLGNNKPVEGWAPIMGVVSMGFTGVFTLFTFTLKYLTLILNLVFVKKRNLIESIERIA